MTDTHNRKSGYWWLRLLPGFLREKVERHQALQNILDNTGWLLTDKILPLGIGLFVSVWVARYLGPGQFGILSYVLAFVSIFGALAALGLNDIIVRDVLNEPEARDEILGSTIVLTLVGGMLSWGLAVAIVMYLRPDDELSAIMVLFAAGSLVFKAFNTLDFWFQSQLQAKYAVWSRNVSYVIFALVKIGLVLAKAPLQMFALVVMGEAALVALFLAYCFHSRGYSLFRLKVNTDRVIFLLRQGWPLLIQGLSVMLYMRVDQIMLGQMATVKEVGEYAVAVQLVEVWYIVPMALMGSLFPAIVNCRKNSPGLYESRIQNLYDLMVWMSFAVAATVTFVAPWLVWLLFGPAYQASALILQILVWMSLSVYFNLARQKWLIAEGLLMPGLYLNLIGVVLNLGANYLLIPHYGAMGAAAASLLTMFGANVLIAFISAPMRKSLVMYLKSLYAPVRWAKKLSQTEV